MSVLPQTASLIGEKIFLHIRRPFLGQGLTKNCHPFFILCEQAPKVLFLLSMYHVYSIIELTTLIWAVTGWEPSIGFSGGLLGLRQTEHKDRWVRTTEDNGCGRTLLQIGISMTIGGLTWNHCLPLVHQCTYSKTVIFKGPPKYSPGWGFLCSVVIFKSLLCLSAVALPSPGQSNPGAGRLWTDWFAVFLP